MWRHLQRPYEIALSIVAWAGLLVTVWLNVIFQRGQDVMHDGDSNWPWVMWLLGAFVFTCFWFIPGMRAQGNDFSWLGKERTKRLKQWMAELLAPLPRWARYLVQAAWICAVGLMLFSIAIQPPGVHAGQRYGPTGVATPAKPSEVRQEDESGLVFMSGWMLGVCFLPAIRLFYPSKKQFS